MSILKEEGKEERRAISIFFNIQMLEIYYSAWISPPFTLNLNKCNAT